MNRPPYQKLNPGELQLGDIVTQGESSRCHYKVVTMNPAHIKLIALPEGMSQHDLGTIYANEDYNQWGWYLVSRKKRKKIYL